MNPTSDRPIPNRPVMRVPHRETQSYRETRTQSDEAHERSIRDLVSDTANDAMTLIRQEVEIAKLEVSDRISQAKTTGATMGVAAVLLHWGFVLLLAGIVFSLVWVGMALWSATLLVAALTLAGGFAALMYARTTAQRATTAPDLRPRSQYDEERRRQLS